ncbi:hypothetical protein IC232_29955 [Microvirga sp. BT688]|uniref:hypothetical protein n=1 Tax=Microvirga sp. TaxID=1873136 RepID=UPI001689BF70|nr:hypothetical protein [Microvirga sp.]MBD2750868.1 hypothetical protein [Microvirga sp.]
MTPRLAIPRYTAKLNATEPKTEALRLGEKLPEGCADLSPDYSSKIVIEIVDEELRPILAIPYAEIADQLIPARGSHVVTACPVSTKEKRASQGAL